MTELNKLQSDEIKKKVRKMSNLELLSELEDTVQFDLLRQHNTSEFIKSNDAKAFWAIKKELRRRLKVLEALDVNIDFLR